MSESIKIGAPEAYKHAKDDIKCKWSENKSKENDPHVHEEYKPPTNDIKDSVIDLIGNTPMVRLNKIPKSEGVKCEIVAKCEFLSCGGSVKDRISRRMVLDAEKQGRIKPGDALIEATSGNTGVGMALLAAVKGYRMIITVPEKTSDEKVNIMKGLGAETIRPKAEEAYKDPECHLETAKKMAEEIPRCHLLDQYSNPSNPLAHYDGTAEEIIDQCNGKVDYIFCGAGTGGTITGIGRKIREKLPNCKVIGVDPFGSILSLPKELNETDIENPKIEGTGYEFIPKSIDRTVVDQWIKVDDEASFKMARRLIREEGLLVGGSAGQIVAAAVHYAKEMKLGEGVRCVVILPDSIRNYLTKFLSDDWMVRCGYMELSSLEDKKNPFYGIHWEKLELKEAKYVSKDVTIAEAKNLLAQGHKYIPVVDKKIIGYISHKSFMKAITNRKLEGDKSALAAVVKDVPIVPKDTDVCIISKLLEKNDAVVINVTEKNEDAREAIGTLYVAESEDLLKLTHV